MSNEATDNPDNPDNPEDISEISEWSGSKGWRHRVFRKTEENGESSLSIREAYYNKDNEVFTWTVSPIAPSGKNIDELRWSLEHMLKALDEPILEDVEYE